MGGEEATENGRRKAGEGGQQKSDGESQAAVARTKTKMECESIAAIVVEAVDSSGNLHDGCQRSNFGEERKAIIVTLCTVAQPQVPEAIPSEFQSDPFRLGIVQTWLCAVKRFTTLKHAMSRLPGLPMRPGDRPVQFISFA